MFVQLVYIVPWSYFTKLLIEYLCIEAQKVAKHITMPIRDGSDLKAE